MCPANNSRVAFQTKTSPNSAILATPYQAISAHQGNESWPRGVRLSNSNIAAMPPNWITAYSDRSPVACQYKTLAGPTTSISSRTMKPLRLLMRSASIAPNTPAKTMVIGNLSPTSVSFVGFQWK